MSDETAKKELYSVDTNTMLWETWHLEELKADLPYHLEVKE